MAVHNDLGRMGESIAMDYLIQKGYQIISQNYRYRKGEIDLIVKNTNGNWVFIEVKTRKGGGEPEVAVNKKKIKLLLETMEQYKIENNIIDETLLDIIAIVIIDNKPPEIEHFEDVWLY